MEQKLEESEHEADKTETKLKLMESVLGNAQIPQMYIRFMVIILDGNSEHVVHMGRK